MISFYPSRIVVILRDAELQFKRIGEQQPLTGRFILQFLHEVEQIAHGLPVDDLAQIHLREEVYFTHIEFVLIAKFLYFLEELHQSVAAGLCTEFYFAYHSRKVTALEILVDIAYGTMYLTFILGKLAYRFGDALNDVCIAFADLFLKIEDLIIIHKLAEVGGKSR